MNLASLAKISAKLLITGAALGWLLSTIDLGATANILVSAELGPLMICVILYASNFAVCGIRWHTILRVFGQSPTIWFSTNASFIAGFFSQVAPGGGYGGDIYRVIALGGKIGSNMTALLTVLLDRASGMIAATLSVVVGCPLVLLYFPDERPVFALIGGLTGAALLAFLLACAYGQKLPEIGLMKRIRMIDLLRIEKVVRAFSIVFLRWSVLRVHLSWSLFALAIYILALWLIGLALRVEVSFVVYALLGPIVFLAKSFPLSLAGWGVREAAVVYFFGMAGVGEESALALSALSGLLTLVASLIGGFLWLGQGNRLVS